MGTWGAGLYEDDEAADLKANISLIAKIPANGDRLLEILLEQRGNTPQLTDDGGPTFWLVLGDQFERRGIYSKAVSDTALNAIESGFDLKDLENRGLDAKVLEKREKILHELRARLKSPRQERKLSKNPRLPDPVLQVGEVYAFPTENGFACSPWRLPSKGEFTPDGWGAMIVLECDRAFQWLPWCALASLTIDPTQKPTIDDAIQENLIFHLQTHGAARCVPKRADAKTMRLELLGRVTLDPDKVKPHLSKWSVNSAIECGWSIAYAGYSTNVAGPPRGPKLSSLIRSP